MRLFPVSCRLRCHSSLAQTLPPEEAPVDRPFWGVDDPDMPLPFDLADIINRVESLLWRWALHVGLWKLAYAHVVYIHIPYSGLKTHFKNRLYPFCVVFSLFHTHSCTQV